MEEIEKTASLLVEGNKGLLAADESDHTIKKRFDMISLESTEENRRTYRELLFTAPEIEKYISGVILFDETIKQRSHAGIPFPELISQRGIIPGIKVDQGTVELTNFPGEKVTEGLDGLSSRLTEYKSMGAKFTKWRAVITIGDKIPTQTCVDVNATILARYASIAQTVGLVPIVEPEVLMDGNHSIDKCREVTYLTLKTVFSKLSEYKVNFKGVLLKPNMVISGKESQEKATKEQIAELTTKVFAEVIPDEVPGVVFLSGGQSPEEATVNLNEINKFAQMKWKLSFSYGRALQEPVLKAWMGNPENVKNAQSVFLKRAHLNSLATLGQYNPSLETSS